MLYNANDFRRFVDPHFANELVSYLSRIRNGKFYIPTMMLDFAIPKPGGTEKRKRHKGTKVGQAWSRRMKGQNWNPSTIRKRNFERGRLLTTIIFEASRLKFMAQNLRWTFTFSSWANDIFQNYFGKIRVTRDTRKSNFVHWVLLTNRLIKVTNSHPYQSPWEEGDQCCHVLYIYVHNYPKNF